MKICAELSSISQFTLKEGINVREDRRGEIGIEIQVIAHSKLISVVM